MAQKIEIGTVKWVRRNPIQFSQVVRGQLCVLSEVTVWGAQETGPLPSSLLGVLERLASGQEARKTTWWRRPKRWVQQASKNPVLFSLHFLSFLRCFKHELQGRAGWPHLRDLHLSSWDPPASVLGLRHVPLCQVFWNPLYKANTFSHWGVQQILSPSGDR